MMENGNQAQGNAHTLETIAKVTENITAYRGKVENLRKLMDEGSYKIDSLLRIIQSFRERELNILASGGENAAAQQISEEQVDRLLEMIKSPAFLSLAKQLLMKMAAGSPPKEQA